MLLDPNPFHRHNLLTLAVIAAGLALILIMGGP